MVIIINDIGRHISIAWTVVVGCQLVAAVVVINVGGGHCVGIAWMVVVVVVGGGGGGRGRHHCHHCGWWWLALSAVGYGCGEGLTGDYVGSGGHGRRHHHCHCGWWWLALSVVGCGHGGGLLLTMLGVVAMAVIIVVTTGDGGG